MGLSIHYHGIIRNYSLIDELSDEVKDICKSLDWKYHIWRKRNFANDSAHINNPNFLNYSLEDLKGISILPEKCEPIELAFLPSGLLCSPIKIKYNNPDANDLMVETVSAKTQFAGIDIHITVLKLLQYLKDKYFSVFELSDEGMYWETKDEKILKLQFVKYNYILETVGNALSDFKAASGETAGSLADKLKEFLRKNYKVRENHWVSQRLKTIASSSETRTNN